MSNGSRYAVQVAPPDLRCPNFHRLAEVKNTSINPDPTCPGQCMLIKGHPHPGRQTQAAIPLAADAAKLLVEEGVAFVDVWQYDPGGCCLCAVCGYWIKDWMAL